MEVVIRPAGEPVVRWAIKHLADPDITSLSDIGDCVALGIMLNKKPIGACIFHDYQEMTHGNDMRVMLVSTDSRWCQRHVLRAIFEHPFITCKCSRLTAIIREGNEKSVKLVTGLGFRKEGVVRRGYNGKTNALIYGMLRSECKWLESSNGKKVFKGSAASAGGAGYSGANAG